MPTPISEDHAEFGRRVRAARKDAGYSQEHFAFVCGVDRSYLARIERGQANATIENVWRITRSLKIEPGQLLDRISD